ncbi:MAG: hypothetical protein WAL59_28400 [Roseiarcus sp.]
MIAAPWKDRAPEGESITFVRAMAANHNSHLLGQQHHRMRATALLSADIDRAASDWRLQLAQSPCNGI